METAAAHCGYAAERHVLPGVDGVDSILVTLMTYAARDNGMIELFSGQNGSLKIERTASGFRFSVQVAALTQGTYSDYLLLTSQQTLIDWSDPSMLSRWAKLQPDRHQPLVLQRLLLYRTFDLLSVRRELLLLASGGAYCRQDGKRHRSSRPPARSVWR